MEMSVYRPKLLAASIVLVLALGMLASTIYVASVPEIAERLATSVGVVQLTFVGYLLALAIGGLLMGPLCDRYGRKTVLVPGLLLFVFGSLACAVSPTIEFLIMARVLQGIGAAAGSVVGRAVICDAYGDGAAARVLASAGFAITLVQGLAPALGGQFQFWFGWRANFLATTVLGLLAVALIARILPRDRERPLRPKSRYGGFSQLLSTRQFLGYATLATGTRASFHIFAAGAPAVLIAALGVAPEIYGLYVLLPPGGFLVGSFLCATWRVGGERLIIIGGVLLIVAGVAMVVLASVWPSPLAIVIPMILVCCASGLVTPCATAASLRADPALVGAASALVSFLQLAGAALGTAVLSAFATGPIGLAIVIACSGAFGVTAFLALTARSAVLPLIEASRAR